MSGSADVRCTQREGDGAESGLEKSRVRFGSHYAISVGPRSGWWEPSLPWELAVLGPPGARSRKCAEPQSLF